MLFSVVICTSRVALISMATSYKHIYLEQVCLSNKIIRHQNKKTKKHFELRSITTIEIAGNYRQIVFDMSTQELVLRWHH